MFARVHEHFIAQTREAARAGAKIVVWPEANIMVFRADQPELRQRLQDLSRSLGIYCLAGVAIADPAADRVKFENRALLFAPDGTLVANYIKTTAVPGFEARFGARGDGRLPVVATPYGRVTMAICYDLDFPWLIRQAGQQRADLLLVPASDWRAIGVLHHAAATFRAVENGVTMVRATRWGISSMVDATGRAVAMLDHHAKPSVLLVAEIPVGARPGMYARIGDGFAWACIAALAGLVSWALARAAGLV
jgi:apolipoprotein N-acyltransferase